MCDSSPCYDLERTICDYLKNYSRFSYRRLRETAKIHRNDKRNKSGRFSETKKHLNNCSPKIKKSLGNCCLHINYSRVPWFFKISLSTIPKALTKSSINSMPISITVHRQTKFYSSQQLTYISLIKVFFA